MVELEPRGGEIKTGLKDEALTALKGLRAVVRPDVWPGWSQLMPAGPETVEVSVSSIYFDTEGNPVAFGVNYGEMLRTIAEQGDPESPLTRLIALQPTREHKVTIDGTKSWSAHELAPSGITAMGSDIYEVSHI